MRKSVLFLLFGALAAGLLCGFGAVPQTGDTRPFALMIAAAVVSGVVVVGLIVFLIIRSVNSGKRNRPK